MKTNLRIICRQLSSWFFSRPFHCRYNNQWDLGNDSLLILRPLYIRYYIGSFFVLPLDKSNFYYNLIIFHSIYYLNEPQRFFLIPIPYIHSLTDLLLFVETSLIYTFISVSCSIQRKLSNYEILTPACQ